MNGNPSLKSKFVCGLSARVKSAVLVTVVLFTLFATQAALAVDEGFQWWQPVYVDFPLLDAKIRGYVESNSRLNDGLHGINQYQLRTALGYRPKKSIEFYQGYLYGNTYRPNGRIQEHRIYQQAGVGSVLFKRIQVLNRLRTEQRFIESSSGCANRIRYLLRLATPIKNTRWYVVASDELFINLNTTEGGPTAGFDQNRLYGGLGRQVNNKIRLEVGYQYQHVNQTDPSADKANHILMTQTFFSL